MVLLIHPPVAKPCEPPAGIARLAGLLAARGVEHRLFDANLECMLHLLLTPEGREKTTDVWTRRAVRNSGKNIRDMRNSSLYRSVSRYSRAVKDVSRVIASRMPEAVSAGLANYEDRGLSPLRSADLIHAAEMPELNPFHPFFAARIRGLFREREPEVVGISLNYLSQALPAFAMIGLLRREHPTTAIVLGGGLVTTWMRNPAWKNPFGGLVDTFVAGPGEDALMRFLGGAPAGSELPRPDYRLLAGLPYLSPGFVLPYAASSGCSWHRCSFCPEKAEANPYLPVPLQQARTDIRALSEVFQPSLIHFVDNAVSPALLEECALRPPGAPWYGFARISSQLADPDFCIALRQSGCVMLKLGIESGDQRVLDALEKGISIETASAVLKNLRKAGIGTYVYLLFGTPAEDERAARSTHEFAVRHAECIGYLNLAIFNMPLCGTAGSGLETIGFSPGDLSLYTDFRHPRGWDRRGVRRFLEREFRAHPLIAPILRREPPVFTSNHAPFFLLASGKEAAPKLYKKQGPFA